MSYNIEANVKPFRDFTYNQHDVVCNQKYNGNLPYSFHLMCVEAQVDKFKHLLTPQEYFVAKCGAIGHDLIEDARVTYNDVVTVTKNRLKNPFFENRFRETRIADVIYACTELRGHNRSERHGKEYLDGIKSDRLGLFVKLCDIAANKTFSSLTHSSMYKKYNKEFPHFKEECFREEFTELFDYIENI